MIERLEKLRDKWISHLEKDSETVSPNYAIEGANYEWADWRLNLTQSIRELSFLIEEEKRRATEVTHAGSRGKEFL